MADIPDAELKELLSGMAEMRKQLAALQEQNGIGSPRILRKVTQSKVNLRRVDGKVVIGFRNRGTEQAPVYVYEKVDPNDKNNKIAYVDIILEGMASEADAYPVEFVEFLNEAERVLCLVKEVKQSEVIEEQGSVKKKEVDEYSTVELDYEVPLEVITIKRRLIVTLPDSGREVEVDERYVNM